MKLALFKLLIHTHTHTESTILFHIHDRPRLAGVTLIDSIDSACLSHPEMTGSFALVASQMTVILSGFKLTNSGRDGARNTAFLLLEELA